MFYHKMMNNQMCLAWMAVQCPVSCEACPGMAHEGLLTTTVEPETTTVAPTEAPCADMEGPVNDDKGIFFSIHFVIVESLSKKFCLGLFI